MNSAFYTGVSGMIAFQEHMNTTAHNIANSGTTGYKSSRSSFSDLLYTQMDVKTDGEKMAGHGVKNGGPDLIMGQSSLRMTDQPLDFAIVGDGYFALDDGSGVRKYTRNGNFSVSSEGKNNYLVSRMDGSYVLDGRGRKITVTKGDKGDYDTAAVSDALGVYTFNNAFGLQRANGACFTESDNSGRAKSITGTDAYDLRTSTLENSGVNLGDEMLNVIQSQRAFQMNSKIVQTADQIEEMINNLR